MVLSLMTLIIVMGVNNNNKGDNMFNLYELKLLPTYSEWKKNVQKVSDASVKFWEDFWNDIFTSKKK